MACLSAVTSVRRRGYIAAVELDLRSTELATPNNALPSLPGFRAVAV
jgi:hypothetical protein